MKKAILQMFTAILVLGLFCGAASADPVIIAKTPAGNSTVEEAVGTIQTFKLQTNETTSIDWLVKGIEPQNTSYYTENNTSTLTHTIESGEYEIEATVRSTGDSRTWDVNGTAASTGGNVTVTPAVGPVTVIPGKSQTFKVNATDDQEMNVEWFIDDESKQNDEGVTSSSYKFEESTKGQYTLKAEITDPNGVYKSSTKTWTVNVQSASHSSGNRIWDESQNMSKTYTWNAQSYSGFYYDLDSGVSSEEMTITDIGRNIDSGNIEYVTRPTETKFEYDKWGSYQVIGFMAEKYFAGYSKGNSTVIGDDVSLISDGILAKVLTDSDDRKSANAGQSLPLEEGYSLNVKEVDVNGNSVWIQLEKDGKVVEDGFVSSNQDYVYKKDIGDATDMPVIIVHFGTVFSGTETSAVFIQGIFQISDDYVEIKNGDTFEKMEVKSIGSDEIKMENSDDIGLDKGDTVDLMGKIKIQVADNNELRFAPILDTSEAGIYELRGTVYDEGIDDTLPVSWTPFNFEGFYYNIDEGIGTEELTVEELDGKSIPSDKLVYKSTPQPVEFEHNNWGNFTVVGFMADKYFAGYPDGAVNGEVDRVSLLSNDILSKVLTDSDDKVSMYSGSAFTLEDGYSLSIKEVDVNGNSVWVQLEKDGKVVEDAFVSSNKDYVYKTNIGKAEDIPLIIVHFGTVFSGTETSAVFIQGIFQISSDYTEISNKESFGKMEVSSVSEDGITMKNNDDIGLDGGDTTEIMGNVSFKTADSSTLRFYPFVQIDTTNGTPGDGLYVKLPDEIIQGEAFNIQVTAKDKPVEGASVEINATSAGKTDANGTLAYTAENTGALKLTVKKDGYATVSKSVNVIPPKEKMTVNILPEMVYVGSNITIEAIKSIGGDPIEGANVSINGKVFDKTGSDGKMTYKADKNGTFRVGVAKEGFQNQSIDVNVRNFEAIYEFSNLVIDPIEVSAGKNTTISVNVNNTGNAAGNNSVELLVNGNVTDSKVVPLDVGKNTTVTFEHGEEVPGSYKVEVGGETATYTVTEKSSLIWYVLGAFILLIIGGAAYYFTKGGGDVAEVQKKIQELIDSVKPKK
ncbi:MAG TPA: S-layer protein domain-containing protein [Methanosarcina sp.]|nr:S-layer protein domain-containing protein [Methanosarcina sp.]